MKRKPSKIKHLHGTNRPDRRGRVAAEGTKSIDALRMPPGLAPEVQKVWRRLIPAILEHGLQPVDTPALVDLCTCVVRLQEAEAAIERHGLIVKGYRGGAVKNPAVSVAANYRAALLKWVDKFGMTPASRSKLVLPEQEPAEPEILDPKAIPWEVAIAAHNRRVKSEHL
jgi:P27 family predicted phage terminase small subunit